MAAGPPKFEHFLGTDNVDGIKECATERADNRPHYNVCEILKRRSVLLLFVAI
jgi:hypothetical protein